MSDVIIGEHSNVTSHELENDVANHVTGRRFDVHQHGARFKMADTRGACHGERLPHAHHFLSSKTKADDTITSAVGDSVQALQAILGSLCF